MRFARIGVVPHRLNAHAMATSFGKSRPEVQVKGECAYRHLYSLGRIVDGLFGEDLSRPVTVAVRSCEHNQQFKHHQIDPDRLLKALRVTICP